MNILLVEDEPELSQMAAETMESMGHKVTAVAGVEEAIGILEDPAKDIGLMIADHRLPDGWGVALCLQCRVKYPRMKVAVVSGCLTPENIEFLRQMPMSIRDESNSIFYVHASPKDPNDWNYVLTMGDARTNFN